MFFVLIRNTLYDWNFLYDPDTHEFVFGLLLCDGNILLILFKQGSLSNTQNYSSSSTCTNLSSFSTQPCNLFDIE